jgi:hypothetical protein
LTSNQKPLTTEHNCSNVSGFFYTPMTHSPRALNVKNNHVNTVISHQNRLIFTEMLTAAYIPVYHFSSPP